MLHQLTERDAFSVVTYSSGAETVLPIQPVNAANLRAAEVAIGAISDGGGTCISCGLEVAMSELARSPTAHGIRRVLLISDGQATLGISSRDALVAFAAGKVVQGASISAVGVGLDFDEMTMRRLAEVGRGTYHFVEDASALPAMFDRELALLARTIASDVRLVVTPQPGVQIEAAHGYPITRSASSVVVPIADMPAGATRKVVFRVSVAPSIDPHSPFAQVDLGWRRVSDSEQRGAHEMVHRHQVDFVENIGSGRCGDVIIPPTVVAVEQVLTARTLEAAISAYDQRGLVAAQLILERRAQALRDRYPSHADDISPLQRNLARASEGLAASSQQARERARKAASVAAFTLAR